MTFVAKRITKTHTQINIGSPEIVFPLICPVKEADWLESWNYKMIYSKSGIAEEGCIFLTSVKDMPDTFWYITVHDPESKEIEFVRMTYNETIVKINICLKDNYNGTSTTLISYEYTALNEKQNKWIENESDKYFDNMMKVWEKSINHYIASGERLSLL